jgi:hypothetical protein
VKILDKRRMQKRAWGSASCAAILTLFLAGETIEMAIKPSIPTFFWFVLMAFSTTVEWRSFLFWKSFDLRGPLWSASNQFWLGILCGGHMIWKAYQPVDLGFLAGVPQAPMMQSVSYIANWTGGIIVFLCQVLIAYKFWTGGPRAHHLFQRSRKPAPASEPVA